MTACLSGLEGCTCCTEPISDHMRDLLSLPRGTVPDFCECHNCYECGQLDCAGHEEQL